MGICHEYEAIHTFTQNDIVLSKCILFACGTNDGLQKLWRAGQEFERNLPKIHKRFWKNRMKFTNIHLYMLMFMFMLR